MLANLSFQTADPNVRYRNPFLALRIEGAFDVSAFTAAVDALVEAHDLLRTELDAVSGNSLRTVSSLGGDLVTRTSSGDADHELAAQEWQTFNLNRAPLWRIRVVQTAPQSHIVTFAFSHLIWDGASMRTFLDLVARKYASPGTIDAATQYSAFTNAAIAERADRQNRPTAADQAELLDTIASAVRERRRQARQADELALRKIPFTIAAATLNRLRAVALSTGQSLFNLVLGDYLELAAAITGRESLIAAYARSRLDLRSADDCLGYFSDLALAFAPHAHGGPGTLKVLDPALSWTELAATTDVSLVYPQEVWDVWARGPVFSRASDLRPIFPGCVTTVLPLTPSWRMPVRHPDQRRILGHHVIPTLVVEDLKAGAGYLEFNTATVSRRVAHQLMRDLCADRSVPCAQ